MTTNNNQNEEIFEESSIQNEVSENLDTASNDEDSTDDVQFENIEGEENPRAAIKQLREKLRSCEQEKKEYLDGWQRMRADFANARKEEDTRRGELTKFASEGLVEDLLPVLDSFTMAFSNREAWEKVDANWRKGVEYIYTQFFSVLEARGLTEIGIIGEQLDPRNHIAIETIPTDEELKLHTVAEVVQKGYRLHSKVIRPARVKAWER